MPSLPTSLILVGLVVAWLVVLVPMVAKRRERVPENHDDGARFRVLQRDSSRGRRRPVLSRTAMARAGDASAEGDPAGFYEDSAFYEGSGAVDGPRPQGDVDDDAGVVARARAHDVVSAGPRAEDDSEGADDERRGGRGRRARVVAEAAGMRRGDEGGARGRTAEAVDGTRVGAAVRVSDERDLEGVRDAADDWRQEHLEHPEHPVGATRETSWQREPRADRDRWGEEPRQGPARDRATDDGAVYRTAPVRAGRGGFDPRAAERARAARFRQRRRIALILAAVMLAGVPVGLLGTGYGWVGTAVAGVLLVLYLAYLRRQVRIEDAIRQRRAARLTRAQQIRPSYRPSVAEQVRAHRTGGAAPAADAPDEPGYHVRSHARPTVPPASYRRGTPVDLEDSDPAFDDLEYYRPAAYRRRAG